MSMLPKDLARRWVAALRSGNYRQSRHRLRNEDGYCCLGVFCDVSQVGVWSRTRFGKWGYYISDNPIPDFLFPEQVIEKLGFGSHSLKVEMDRWVGQNDEGISFSMIADDIEKTLGLNDDLSTE